ncbi:hypothetical protein ACHAXT_010207 [Thalassiosira profunda]
MGKVHGSLARAGKVKGQTPKVEAQEKKKQPRGRAKKRMQYNRRYVNVVTGMGGKRKASSVATMVAVAKSSSVFLGWVASQGIETSLDLEHRADGRYMTCNQDIGADDDFLRVPLSACIKADTLEALAERLAYERDAGAKSKRLETVTDGGQLEARMTNDERKDIDQWALACVDSRANFLGEDSYSMTPMLDMIQHDGSVPTRARVKKEKGFAKKNKGFASGAGDVLCLTSGRQYKAGDEAFISYGNLCNIDTLVDYGFVSKNNPCNAESVSVQMMGRPDAPAITVYADGSIDSGAKATLRYYLANKEELEAFSTLEKGSGLGILAKPLSDRNELDVQSFIASTLDEAVYDAKAGASASENDPLVGVYLSERAKLLELAIQRIQAKFPDVLF